MRFVGGMNLLRPNGKLGANATWPLAELVLDDEEGIVRLRRPMRLFFGHEVRVGGFDFAFPEIRFERESVVIARYAGYVSQGVLVTRKGGRKVIFWTSRAIACCAPSLSGARLSPGRRPDDWASVRE